mmetsp:Transcript_2080/g.4794  ORF Transcript_2080/g.4794 Transcript_2080/m.4794 type:complete len:182 (-) Transcript_2080:3331-3876(-)
MEIMGVCACHERACEFDPETDKDIQTELIRRYLAASRAARSTVPPFRTKMPISPVKGSPESSFDDIEDFIQFEPSPAKKTLNKTVGKFYRLQRPRVQLEVQDEEVYHRSKPQAYEAYQDVQEFDLVMELKQSRMHFLRSPAPRLSTDMYQKNLLGLLTDEEEQRSSPMRKSVTYSPVSAIE